MGRSWEYCGDMRGIEGIRTGCLEEYAKQAGLGIFRKMCFISSAVRGEAYSFYVQFKAVLNFWTFIHSYMLEASVQNNLYLNYFIY